MGSSFQPQCSVCTSVSGPLFTKETKHSVLSRTLDGILYMCGSQLNGLEVKSRLGEDPCVLALFDRVYVQENRSCDYPVEIPYYSSEKFAMVCSYCACSGGIQHREGDTPYVTTVGAMGTMVCYCVVYSIERGNTPHVTTWEPWSATVHAVVVERGNTPHVTTMVCSYCACSGGREGEYPSCDYMETMVCSYCACSGGREGEYPSCDYHGNHGLQLLCMQWW